MWRLGGLEEVRRRRVEHRGTTEEAARSLVASGLFLAGHDFRIDVKVVVRSKTGHDLTGEQVLDLTPM